MKSASTSNTEAFDGIKTANYMLAHSSDISAENI